LFRRVFVRVSRFLAWFVVVDALIRMFGVITPPLLLVLTTDTIVGTLIIRDPLALRPATAANNQSND
jgi:hypothetical protein